MAFTQSTFASVGAHSADTPNLFSYKSGDSLEVVTTDSYFLNKRFQFKEGDIILSLLADGHAFLKVTANTSTVAVLDVHLTPKPGTVLALFAFSTDDQEPSGLDNPLQIEYGAGVNTVDDPIMIDGNGNITCNETGTYDIIATYRTGRIGSSGGVAHIYVRGLLNGVQIGNTISSLVTSPAIVIPEQFEIQGTLSEGDVITGEIARDSAGADEGGLYANTSSGTLDWGEAASATIRIFKTN